MSARCRIGLDTGIGRTQRGITRDGFSIFLHTLLVAIVDSVTNHVAPMRFGQITTRSILRHEAEGERYFVECETLALDLANPRGSNRKIEGVVGWAALVL